MVLIGEDSLEANVGYLAALTGGDIFVPAGDDVADVLVAAFDSLRTPFHLPRKVDLYLDHVQAVRGNASLKAHWRPRTMPADRSLHERAVAAIAASLALPFLDEEAASQLAEAEGLVTHLTSLVLVDEAGEVQQGVPAGRKNGLPTPRTLQDAMPSVCAEPMPPEPSYCSRSVSASLGDIEPKYNRPAGNLAAALGARGRRAAYNDLFGVDSSAAAIDLSRIGTSLAWDSEPNRLLAGDLSAIDPDAALLIERAAELPEVVALAKKLGVAPVVLVIALLARAQASMSRSAWRIARTVFGNKPASETTALAVRLGLDAANFMRAS